MSEAIREFFVGHPWCSSIPRDEAVRAAEDGRIGPLPTLEECIAGAKAMMPKSVSATSAPEPENKGNGMRTERVTLEITWIPPSGQERIKSWLPSAVLERWFGAPGESVRVVEECCLDRINMGEVIRERDAAIREREKAEQRADRDFVKCGALADKVIELRARVAELEAAPVAESATTPPPARGWLTEEERDLIAGITDDDDYTEEGQNIAKALLARSTPPEVVLPPMPDCSPMADYGAAWSDCLSAVREALRRAGVNMQQPLPPEPEAERP